MPDAVYLTLVPSEVEAELLCALLRTEGIKCEQRPTNFSVGTMDGMPGGGPREVFVSERDLARAQEILTASASD
ncbi:MAG: putative signal transducing protein [Gaiellaceae bacterium]